MLKPILAVYSCFLFYYYWAHRKSRWNIFKCKSHFINIDCQTTQISSNSKAKFGDSHAYPPPSATFAKINSNYNTYYNQYQNFNARLFTSYELIIFNSWITRITSVLKYLKFITNFLIKNRIHKLTYIYISVSTTVISY